jgi:hypothetical protein
MWKAIANARYYTIGRLKKRRIVQYTVKVSSGELSAMREVKPEPPKFVHSFINKKIAAQYVPASSTLDIAVAEGISLHPENHKMTWRDRKCTQIRLPFMLG